MIIVFQPGYLLQNRIYHPKDKYCFQNVAYKKTPATKPRFYFLFLKR